MFFPRAAALIPRARRLHDFDQQEPYLRKILGVIGLTRIEFVYAEHQSSDPEAAAQGSGPRRKRAGRSRRLINGARRPCTLDCMSSLRIAAVIPARLQSTRMARKVLRPIAGRPMVEWVWRAASASGLMDPVVVATDAEEVAEVCRARSIPVVMTSAACPSGSDRVREVSRQIDADIYVNIQGDEPTLTADFFPPLLDLFDAARSGSDHALGALPA